MSGDAPEPPRRGPSGEDGAPGPRRAPVEGPTDPQRREAIAWLWRLPVLLALGGGGWGLYRAIRTHFLKGVPDPEPSFVDGPRVPVAPLASFGDPWDHREFAYDGVPALAVRLPGPIPGSLQAGGGHLAAFSRICTHERCLVNLNRDAEAIAFAYNYRAEGPHLVCPCHLSVFDATEAGRAVSGPAVEPLPRLRLEADDELLVATGREAPPDGPAG